jgi:hypothetical protein
MNAVVEHEDELKQRNYVRKSNPKKRTTTRNTAKMRAIPDSAVPGQQGGPAVASSIGPFA